MADKKYAAFQSKLIPGIDPKSVIGVRTPDLRNLAKSLKGSEEAKKFLEEVPHKYFEENQLHAFLISQIRDFDECVKELERFLPYIDNWATCDQTSPVCFKKNRAQLLPFIKNWIKSKKTYTVRFAIGMLMKHFLEGDFKPEYLRMVCGVKSEEYYIKMEIAWYFATALAFQYEETIPFIEKKVLEPWTHNKTIQKARESFRISDDKKEYLKSLKL